MFRTLMLGTLAALAACGGANDRVLNGTLPDGADGAYALDGARQIDATVEAGKMTLDLAGAGPVDVFVDADGMSWPLLFPADATGATWDTTIPDFSGTIDLGSVSLVAGSVARTDEGDDHAEAENNPLDEIDCDGDGASDFDDDDDDGDGVGDVDDDDDDHECEAGDDDDDEEDDDDGDDTD